MQTSYNDLPGNVIDSFDVNGVFFFQCFDYTNDTVTFVGDLNKRGEFPVSFVFTPHCKAKAVCVDNQMHDIGNLRFTDGFRTITFEFKAAFLTKYPTLKPDSVTLCTADFIRAEMQLVRLLTTLNPEVFLHSGLEPSCPPTPTQALELANLQKP